MTTEHNNSHYNAPMLPKWRRETKPTNIIHIINTKHRLALGIEHKMLTEEPSTLSTDSQESHQSLGYETRQTHNHLQMLCCWSIET